MMMNPLVSIVIPVYNVEGLYNKGEDFYRCVNSVISQSYVSWELFLFDDGSTDSTPQICEKFAKSDTRIKVIHTNDFRPTGPYLGRNLGIDEAVGQYIYFMDDDDYIDSLALEKLVQNAEKYKSDVVISPFYIERISRGKSEQIKMPLRMCGRGKTNQLLYSGRIEIEEYFAKSMIFHGEDSSGLNEVWNKLYRKSFLINNSLKFPMSYCEDWLFNIEVFSNNPVVSISDFPFYHWVRRDNFQTLSQHYNHEKYDFIKKSFIHFEELFSGIFNSENKIIKDKKIVRNAWLDIENILRYETTEQKEKILAIIEDDEYKSAIKSPNKLYSFFGDYQKLWYILHVFKGKSRILIKNMKEYIQVKQIKGGHHEI